MKTENADEREASARLRIGIAPRHLFAGVGVRQHIDTAHACTSFGIMFCSHLAMKGPPARAIQELAGRADLSTTRRYMHLSPAATEDAIRLSGGAGLLSPRQRA